MGCKLFPTIGPQCGFLRRADDLDTDAFTLQTVRPFEDDGLFDIIVTEQYILNIRRINRQSGHIDHFVETTEEQQFAGTRLPH